MAKVVPFRKSRSTDDSLTNNRQDKIKSILQEASNLLKEEHKHQLAWLLEDYVDLLSADHLVGDTYDIGFHDQKSIEQKVVMSLCPELRDPESRGPRFKHQHLNAELNAPLNPKYRQQPALKQPSRLPDARSILKGDGSMDSFFRRK